MCQPFSEAQTLSPVVWMVISSILTLSGNLKLDQPTHDPLVINRKVRIDVLFPKSFELLLQVLWPHLGGQNHHRHLSSIIQSKIQSNQQRQVPSKQR